PAFMCTTAASNCCTASGGSGASAAAALALASSFAPFAAPRLALCSPAPADRAASLEGVEPQAARNNAHNKSADARQIAPEGLADRVAGWMSAQARHIVFTDLGTRIARRNEFREHIETALPPFVVDAAAHALRIRFVQLDRFLF